MFGHFFGTSVTTGISVVHTLKGTPGKGNAFWAKHHVSENSEFVNSILGPISTGSESPSTTSRTAPRAGPKKTPTPNIVPFATVKGHWTGQVYGAIPAFFKK